jgi:hypothetical protein
MSVYKLRKHKQICSQDEVVTGKQLKEFVKQFKDEELITAIFINEKIVREEHTDGWLINESYDEFQIEKLTTNQVKKVLNKIHKWNLNREFGWQELNRLNSQVKK